jgi:hypothetical protein
VQAFQKDAGTPLGLLALNYVDGRDKPAMTASIDSIILLRRLCLSSVGATPRNLRTSLNGQDRSHVAQMVFFRACGGGHFHGGH